MLLHDQILTNPSLDFKFIESLTRVIRETYPVDSFNAKDSISIDPYMQKDKLINIFSVNLHKIPRLLMANANELHIIYKLYSAIERVFWKDLYKFQSEERSNGFSTLDWLCSHEQFHQIRNTVESDYYQKDSNQKIIQWHKPSVIDIVASPSSAFAQALLNTGSLTSGERLELIKNIYTTNYCDKEKYLFETSNRATVFWDAYLKYVTDNLQPTENKEIIIAVLDNNLSKLQKAMEFNANQDLRITTLKEVRQRIALPKQSMSDVRYDGLSLKINESSSQSEITAWVTDTLPKIKTRYIAQIWKDGKISEGLLKKIILSIFEENSIAGLQMLNRFNQTSELPLELKRAIHWGIWTSRDNGTSFKFECCDLLKVTQNEIYNWSKEEAFTAFHKVDDDPSAMQLVMECHELVLEDLLLMLEHLSSRYETLKTRGVELSKGDRAIQGNIAKIVEKIAVDFVFNGNKNININPVQLATFLEKSVSIDKLTSNDLRQINPSLLLSAIKIGDRNFDEIIMAKHEIQETIVAIALSQKLTSMDAQPTNIRRQSL
ncbi:hypothetical protein [Aeromonas hydrophila]|uniref:hypothetical protein n=1 Tax=Aeromonas hydrophila TaxID=644 RepID=UPI002B4838CE|nr:hypothetical protein [Aeromonas hydrophila]